MALLGPPSRIAPGCSYSFSTTTGPPGNAFTVSSLLGSPLSITDPNMEIVARRAGLIDYAAAPGAIWTQVYQRMPRSEASLVSYWRLNELSGTLAADVKSAINGTYTSGLNQAAPPITNDPTSYATQFNANSGHVDIPDAAALRLSGPLTVEAWVRTAAVPGDVGGIFEKTVGGAINSSASMFVEASRFNFRVQPPGNPLITDRYQEDILPNSIYHVVGVFDGTKAWVYVNGLNNTGGYPVGSSTIVTGVGPSIIGALAEGYYLSNLAISDVAIYNTALSPATIAAHYTAGRTGSYTAAILGTISVTHYWRLGESSGTVAADSGGAAPGTYQGGYTLGQPGALVSDSNTAVALNNGSVSVPVDVGGGGTLGSGTIEFWGYANALDLLRNGVVYTADDGGSTYSQRLMVSADGSVQAMIFDGAQRTATSAAGLVTANTWHHYAMTWTDVGSLVLYVDGVQRGTTAIGGSWKGGNKLLFGAAGGPTNPWLGRIDEAAVYSTALSPAAIAAHYAAR